MISIPLVENIDTTVVFRNAQNEAVAEVDLLQLESLLASSKDGLDLKTDQGKNQWMLTFSKRLSQLIGQPITPMKASLIATKVISAFNDLKKTFESMWKSQNFTDSTPLEPSPQGNSIPGLSPSTTAQSPDSQPSVNSVLEALKPSSPPSEPTNSSLQQQAT